MASFKELVRREKHVVVHGQPGWFRIIKYIVFILVAIWLYRWKGLPVVGLVFLCLAVGGTSLHFVLRWKTKGWTQSWGPYKKILLD